MKRRPRKPLSLLCIDISGCKRVNESFGYATGDALFRDVAERLRTGVRGRDIVGRVRCARGGDFLVLAASVIRDSDAATVAERLLYQMREETIGETGIPAKAYVGIARYPRDGRNAEDLIDCSRSALYQAKREGTSCIGFYEETADRAMRREQDRLKALRSALDSGEVCLHYQPQIDISTGQVVGVEALLRWHHPSEGLLLPGDFLPAAEQTGLMPTIDAWVLREACRDSTRWRAEGCFLPVAVNISARSVRMSLVDNVDAALRETGLPPECLEIELTETALLNAAGNGAAALLETLAKWGVRLAIDDFGTAYASLSYVRSLPIHTLKIDRQFVQAAPHWPKDAAIIHAVQDLCRSVGMRAVAEGVETEEQRQRLQDLGCTTCQGYVLGRPMPAEKVCEFTRAGASG